MRSLFASEPKIQSEFANDANVVIHTGDTREFLMTVPDEAVALIVTSPPYNIGKEYETRTSIGEYLRTQSSVIRELVRVLRSDGSICWQVGNYVQNSEVFPLDTFYYQIFKDHGLKLRNRIIWHFEHGLHASKRFSGRYETLLWFTKSDKYVFNLDSVRVPAKYPGKTNFKGPNRGKPSGNPLGKNPSDLWRFLESEWDNEVWNIPNVKANHPEKTKHPCQFPIELVERCVLALTNPQTWVLDPYCGVGSSLIAAIRHDRKTAGVDKEPEYTALAADRIHRLFEGSLRIRPIGKPVYQPTGREKVSQIPLEWMSAKGKGDRTP
ncbi:site-specific DNA-methyltransferase [candidate division GN15 bacterium]|uniref:Methyltransferase n=1 Tax=candidate division GN15 bacterium TaxID=2072418 RepID=A0A855X414_9BACT|nr:MAG: site-specific DNA-methyltransferase [candidate division GN15 bacterium]